MSGRFRRVVVASIGVGCWPGAPWVWAQDPVTFVPATPPALVLPGDMSAPMTVPAGCAPRRGLLQRPLDRIRYKWRDHFVGYPEYFNEPENGWALYQAMGRQKNKADVHTFTLYRSDFIAGTAELSPGGARRLSFMAPRLETWPGPVVVEWTPDAPEIGEARRYAVLAALQGSGPGVMSDRVVVGPSAYRGLMGPDAGNNHDALIFRDYTAPRAYSVTPTSTAEFGGGAR